jgi:DNA-binding LacI/PurR family transcriptional regulator
MTTGGPVSRMEQKPATLDDVALRSGVNKTTVSTVLNGSRSNTRVSEATRRRIRQAVEELNYYPNAAARGLRRARLDTIGVSMHSLGRLAISNPYGYQVLQGIVQAAHDARYNVTHVHKPWPDVSRSLEGFRSDLVDGMVIVAPDKDDPMIANLAARGVPAVAVSVPAEACGIPTVEVDNASGARAVMDHLLTLGHKRIAFLTWPDVPHDTHVRRETYLDVMAEAGLTVPPEFYQGVIPNYMDQYTDPDVFGLPLDSEIPFEFYEPARRLLARPNRPTAIFACDDRVARDVLQAARDLDISVPDELSVVGFDDIPEASRFEPPLTTVRQPLAEMGAAATRLLLAILSGADLSAQTRWFEPKLIVRESTGPPRA